MSAPTPVFTARFEGGRLKFDRRDAFLGFLGGLEGQPLDVRVSKKRKDHSQNQRSYYFAVICARFAEHVGVDINEAHELLKYKLLWDKTDAAMPIPRGTSGMSKEQFTRYIDDCIRFCAELGCVIEEACLV